MDDVSVNSRMKYNFEETKRIVCLIYRASLSANNIGRSVKGLGARLQVEARKTNGDVQELGNGKQTVLTKRNRLFHFSLIKKSSFRFLQLVNQSPENLGELAAQLAASPSKRYFLLVLMTFVGIIFIIGLFCGRVTRRTIALKNK